MAMGKMVATFLAVIFDHNNFTLEITVISTWIKVRIQKDLPQPDQGADGGRLQEV